MATIGYSRTTLRPGYARALAAGRRISCCSSEGAWLEDRELIDLLVGTMVRGPQLGHRLVWPDEIVIAAHDFSRRRRPDDEDVESPAWDDEDPSVVEA